MRRSSLRPEGARRYSLFSLADRELPAVPMVIERHTDEQALRVAELILVGGEIGIMWLGHRWIGRVHGLRPPQRR
jgi:hypothetical protein